MRLGNLTKYKVDGHTVIFNFGAQEAQIKVLTPTIINVICINGERVHSKAIEGEKAVPGSVRVEEKEDGVWIHTGEVSVRVSSGFYVDFFDKSGNEVCTDYRGDRVHLQKVSDEFLKLLEKEGHTLPGDSQTCAFEVVKKLYGSEHFYGLGDKTGFLDKRYYEYEMWNTDDPSPHVDCFKALYKTIPFFITLADDHVYGIFLDNTYKSYFNMGQESQDYYWFGSSDGNLDYYYIAGSSMADVLKGYTYLTGTCPLPQKWTLGYHQSRWGYMTCEDVEEVAANLRGNDIPCDSIHFDIDYMQDYKVFTWHQEHYHNDPEGCLTKLSEKGFKPVVINDPGVKKEEGYGVYEEGIRGGFFAKTP